MMKLISRITFLIVFFSLLHACNSSEEDEPECVLDIEPQAIFIEIIDDNGANLLANGVLNSEDVRIFFGEVDVAGNIVVEIEPGRPLIAFQAFNLIEDEGESTFELVLSSDITDMVTLDLSITNMICDVTFYQLDALAYNGISQTITLTQDFFGGEQPLVRVVR